MGGVVGVGVVFNFLSAKLNIFLKNHFFLNSIFILAVIQNIAVIKHHLVVLAVDVTYLPILKRITDKIYCFRAR